MKITLKIIAEEAGVSQMTVSRILRGNSNGRVSDSVRERVVSALISHGYDFQKPMRHTSGFPADGGKKIVCILPYENFLTNPPPGNNLNFYRIFEEYCTLNKIPHEYHVGLYANDAVTPAWETLNKIPAGTPVVFYSAYELLAAIALQQRGCRVAVVLCDLFWRNFYAPQLKKMSCFVLNTAAGISQVVHAMRLAGCRRIACAGMHQYLAEPGHPLLAGYDYELKINNESYRHVIPLYGRTEEEFSNTLRQSYKENPFDGLVVPSHILEIYREDLRVKTGLPETLRIGSSNTSERAMAITRVDFVSQFSFRELMPDLVNALLSNKFTPVEKSYDCQLIQIERKK